MKIRMLLVLALVLGVVEGRADSARVALEAPCSWTQEVAHDLAAGVTVMVGRGIGAILGAYVISDSDVALDDQLDGESQPAEGVAGGGFTYKNVSFKSGDGLSEVIGEMTNGSGTSYAAVVFTLSVYDTADRLVDTCPISIMAFPAGATKSWETMCEDVPRMLRYKIAFDSGY